MPSQRLFLLVVLFFMLPLSVQAAQEVVPAGIWLTGDGKAHIKLESCGADVCGTIVWLSEPLYPDTGTPKIDKNNPDESLRTRPIIGLQMMQMAPDPEGGWRGEIYNGQDGNTYQATLRWNGDNLDLRGCIFFGMLCKTQSWTPVVE